MVVDSEPVAKELDWTTGWKRRDFRPKLPGRVRLEGAPQAFYRDAIAFLFRHDQDIVGICHYLAPGGDLVEHWSLDRALVDAVGAGDDLASSGLPEYLGEAHHLHGAR